MGFKRHGYLVLTEAMMFDSDDWVASVFVSRSGLDMELEAHIAFKLPDGVHKLYAAPTKPSPAIRRETTPMPNTPTPDLDRDALEKAKIVCWNALERCGVYAINSNHVEQTILAYLAALPPASGAKPVAEKLGRFGHHPDPAIDFEVEVQALEDEFSNLQASFTNGTPTMAELEARVFRAMDFRVGGDLGAIRAKAALRALEARMKATPTPPSVSSGDGELSREEQIKVLKDTYQFEDYGTYGEEQSLDALHAAGFRIVRTAPSGEKG